MKLPEGQKGDEAYECVQGSLWNDGLNRAPPSQVLDTQIAKRTAAEQEEHSLRLCDGEGRQQLLTLKG